MSCVYFIKNDIIKYTCVYSSTGESVSFLNCRLGVRFPLGAPKLLKFIKADYGLKISPITDYVIGDIFVMILHLIGFQSL